MTAKFNQARKEAFLAALAATCNVKAACAEAIHLLHMHKHKVHGLGKAPGKRWQRPKTLEELKPGIIRKSNIWLAAGELGEEARARDEAEWARRRPSQAQDDPDADRG